MICHLSSVLNKGSQPACVSVIQIYVLQVGAREIAPKLQLLSCEELEQLQIIL